MDRNGIVENREPGGLADGTDDAGTLVVPPVGKLRENRQRKHSQDRRQQYGLTATLPRATLHHPLL